MNTKARRTREKLYDAKRTKFHRMRICVEVDVPDENFERDSFNSAAMTLVGHIQTDPENVFGSGCRVVLVTSEDAK